MLLKDDEIFDVLLGLPVEARDRALLQLTADDAQRQRVQRLVANVAVERPAARDERAPEFEILEHIGSGTHGDVHRARRVGIDGEVALKVIHPRWYSDAEEIAAHVRREAGKARRILSPWVVPVYGAGTLPDGRCYVEMGLCADPDPDILGRVRIGSSLRAWGLLDGRPRLGPREAAAIVLHICEAVQSAHDVGVTHGDVKPENVLLTPDTHRPLLADFGEASTLATAAGRDGPAPRIGTPAYMAPEQWLRRERPDAKSDVYGLGGILLFLLTGRPPHAGRDADADAPRTPTPRHVPDTLAGIVDRALAEDRAARYASARQMAADLAAYLEWRPTLRERARPLRRAALFVRRHALAVIAASAVASVAAALGLWGAAGFRAVERDLAAKQEAIRAKDETIRKADADLAGRRQDALLLESRIEGLNRELGELKSTRDDLVSAQTRLEDLKRQHQALEAERKRLEALTREHAEAGKLREAAERLAAEERGRAEAAAQRAARLEALLAGARDRVAELEPLARRAGDGAARAALLADQLAAATRRNEAFAAELGRAAEELNRARARVQELERHAEREARPSSPVRGPAAPAGSGAAPAP